MTDWKRVKTGVGGSQKGKTYFYEIFIKIACLFKFLYLHLQNVKTYFAILTRQTI